MKVGIDIDDVITETSDSIREFIEKYDETGDVSQFLENVMRGEIPTENVKKFCDKHFIDMFKSAKVKKGATEIMQRILNNGDEIYLITSRGEQRYKGSREVTLEFLKQHNIPYTKILFDSTEKAKICKENQIHVLIDDSAKYCMEATREGVRSILFTSNVNRNTFVPITRVNDWLELEEELSQIKERESDGVLRSSR